LTVDGQRGSLLGGPAAAAEDLQPAPSLRERALRGSLWTIGAYGLHHGLRLAGNVVLARLLFPEAFGLMTLASVFLQGLNMFSDLGLTPAIVQSRRGGDPRFLNTAWTLQVARGLVLWICACILAPVAAGFYGEPMLALLLPAIGSTALVAGLASTKLASASRALRLGRLSAIELGSHALGLAVMVAWAWLSRSVWALAAGAIADSLAKTVMSHLFLPGERNRFHWDREAWAAIRRFGRWILISTALTFFAGQGDRLILGKLLDVGTLGILGIAAALAAMLNEILVRVGERVLFPSYSELVRERPHQIYSSLRKARLAIIAAGWASLFALIALGDELVRLLYDERYSDAGWMLRMLATGMLVGTLNTSYRGLLIAHGKTFEQAAMMAIQVLLKILLIFGGYHLGGTSGVVAAVAFVSWVSFPVHAWFLSRLSLLQLELDVPLMALAGLLTALLYL
jgi:O-antigen/teichoic acid export membrane protein